MWRRLGCGVVAVAVSFGLFGCAEIDRRGGIVDQIEDAVLFRADTKTHRLLRSYTLIGTMMAVARRHGQDTTNQAIIVPHFQAAMNDAYEAYLCLFPLAPTNDDPSLYRCQFFDEKMSRLDYSLYRLALVTLFEKEDRKLLSEVRDRLVGKIPVATDAFRALLHASAATKQTLTVAEQLLELSFSGLDTIAYLLPIYRDILELDMWIIIDNLSATCPSAAPRAAVVYPVPIVVAATAEPLEPVVVPASYSTANPCPTLRYASAIFNNGNGKLRLWRDFIRKLNGEIQNIEAQPIHFQIVGRWLWYSCLEVLKGDNGKRCTEIASKVHASVGANLAFSSPNTARMVYPPYTASVMPTSVIARWRQQQLATERARVPGTAKNGKQAPERSTVVPAEQKASSGTTGSRAIPERSPAPE
jgi:hypothetical protein